ncbi:8-oxo-dGTP diphosphatase [Streptomyces pristinaespiralis]
MLSLRGTADVRFRAARLSVAATTVRRVTYRLLEPRTLDAAICDARRARTVYDNAVEWLLRPEAATSGPLAAEAWVFDSALTHVLLVHHRWRGWVPPGGKVDQGETPREAARRELLEETGVRAEMLGPPAAVTVRSYRADWSATVGISYVAVTDRRTPLAWEDGQPAAWMRLDEPWLAQDRLRMRECTDWFTESA